MMAEKKIKVEMYAFETELIKLCGMQDLAIREMKVEVGVNRPALITAVIYPVPLSPETITKTFRVIEETLDAEDETHGL